MYCHHVQPRVNTTQIYIYIYIYMCMYMYIHVVRRTDLTLDVLLESRTDDSWNVDGGGDLSEPWASFTQLTMLNEKPPKGYTWSRDTLTKLPAISRPDYLWPQVWPSMSKSFQQNEKRHWATEKPKLDNSRKLRGVYYIDPEDTEVLENMKHASERSWKCHWNPPCPANFAVSMSMETCCVASKPTNPRDRALERLNSEIMQILLLRRV